MTEDGLVFAVATRFERDVIASGLRKLDDPALRRWSTVVIAGIGFGERAALDRLQKIDCLVSTGFAAGLRPELAAGRLLAPVSVVGDNGREARASTGPHAAICAALANQFEVCTEPLLQVGEILADPESKRLAARDRPVVGADMESLSIGQYCERRNLPFAVLRVVLDPLDAPLPPSVIAISKDTSAPGFMPLISRLLTNPREWRVFLALLRHTLRARKSLRQAVAPMVTAVAGVLAQS